MDWHRLRVRVNSAGRVLCEPNWRLREAWARNLKDFDLWLVWRGQGWMQTLDQRITLRPGICMWMRPGRQYVASHDPANPLGVIFVHFDLLDRNKPIPPSAAPSTEIIEVADLQYYETVGRRIVHLAREQGGTSPAAAHLLTGLLIDYETQAGAPAAESPQARQQRSWIARVAAEIDERPGQAVSVDELAARAGYSPDHFARLFSRWMGVGPAEYLIRARIGRARQLLLESDLTIGEIAETLGYRDIYFFSRQFRQKVGEPPTAYRRRPRGM